ncbi:hypothetical protein A8144_03955 [Mycobacterium leprae 3125609]|nr:hypothetical protein A8144_03955 [Mycobacterium leprae 3125609]
MHGALDAFTVLIAVELCSFTYPGYKSSLAGVVGSVFFVNGGSRSRRASRRTDSARRVGHGTNLVFVL